MKILHLSDTHGLHRKIKDLPNADVIVHSGDISAYSGDSRSPIPMISVHSVGDLLYRRQS